MNKGRRLIIYFFKFEKYQAMMTKHLRLFISSFILLTFAKAQNNNADSTAVATTLKTLLTICKTVDFTDPKTSELGMFYKAAPYIIYRGDDKARSWKDFANYNNPVEKEGVDAVCIRINESVNRDSSFTIEKYVTKKESEGTWYVLMIKYTKKGVAKKAAFAFLKIGKRFGLGDID
jgi:hypothetical protein